jgi:hypothetical protein
MIEGGGKQKRRREKRRVPSNIIPFRIEQKDVARRGNVLFFKNFLTAPFVPYFLITKFIFGSNIVAKYRIPR